jgi:deoxyribodipyrimidine photo-lyase
VALRFGTISPRQVVEAVGEAGADRTAFVRQIAWRDWFAHLLAELPALPDRALRPELDRIAWRDDPEGLAAWQEGRTGYPLVDAGMRELAATGAMHNRVRMVTASFLVKDLLIDWRRGERHFRHLLADGDVAQNVGNWQWVAGTGPDAAPYFRVFNPVAQSRAHDPGARYLRRWVPEIAALDGQAIHAPWEVGPLELAAAGVTLGETYPAPIVDHAAARLRTLAAYRAARGEDGDDVEGGGRSGGAVS